MNHKNEVVFSFDLPGFKREDIDVDFEGDMIKIKAKKRKEIIKEEGDYYHEERMSSDFSYESTVPEGFNHDGAKIDFKDGVLTVNIPKQVAV